MTENKMNNQIEYMKRPEVEAAFEKYNTVILPIGATEQHGPHMPYGTDTYLAHEMSVRLAKKIKSLILPAMPFGYSWVWRDIPGSVVISVEHVKGIVKDIAHSMARNGMEKMIIINGHGANDSALKYAVRELSDEINMEIYYFTYPGLKEASKHSESEKWHGMVHACELETSWLLTVYPELCDMDKAVKEYPNDREAVKYHNSSLPMGALSNSGVFGDATKATKEKGEVMMEELVNYMFDILEGK
ncbi:creatininase family protein [Halanaerobium sp. ST460_2HS_T2]|uniref:creatininase family protein n=1 Tax=Halanaerobium sp. ST460_2HS_T2 TaxID=2183914 RepID=UPI000DF3D28F|nr:creatininase family protein [Halanaerobium sp. ST460_2HS_T2]RCW49804.1 creatinine amidohydrolase [Halanaerobium sp. ST460_2HS_T2]